MVGVTVDVNAAAIARVQRMLEEVAKQSPKRLAIETRRAALYICQGLKKRTRKAPKKIPRREYLLEPSPLPPRYIHSNGAGNRLLRRWALTRKLGTSSEYTKHYYVYTNAKRGKNGKMTGKNQAEEKREVLARHGGISRAGLAKKSWGWIAKGIYAASNQGDLSWKRIRCERRDPRRYVKGMFNAFGLGAEARITNALDYILEAMPQGAVSDAITAAYKRLEHNIKRNIEKMIKR